MNEPRPNIRVSHVITRLIVGGAQENTVSTVLGLQAGGEFDLELVSGLPEHGQGSLEAEFRGSAASLVFEPNLVRSVHPWKDARALLALRRHFRAAKPAIVHTHSGKAGILGRWAAHLERVPLVIHGIHGPSFGPWQNSFANALFLTAERQASRVTNHFMSVAEAMIRHYLRAGIGSPDKYTRIFSGFKLEPYFNASNDPALRARYGLRPDDLVIGKIARFFKLKGHDDLFEIMPAFVQNIPQARFLLIGGGPWERRCKDFVQSRPELRGKVVFTGLVPPAEIPALCGIMDLLVHLSVREGLARALPQALAAGKPIVAYDCDGAGEVCRNGETGFLVPLGNRPLLIEALQRLAKDAALRKNLGSNGRNFVQERFSVERMVSDTRELYWKLLGHPGLPTEARR